MMATSDHQGELVYYNAADVGAAGPLVSQFVFWHEIGHFRLGHIDRVAATPPGAATVPPMIHTGNKETDADRFACNYWLRRNTAHGLQVIQSAIRYFADMGEAAGDAEHPPPRERMRLLSQYLYSRPAKIVIYNDEHTSPEFVIRILRSSFAMTAPDAHAAIAAIESSGSIAITRIGNADIDIALADRVVADIRIKARFSDQRLFRIEGHVH